jgi:hypothetical protein
MIALLLLLAPAQPYVHPPQGSDGVEATLSIAVRERPDLRSPPRVWLELRVTGPATLEVEPAKFGDEVRAWRVLRASSFTPDGDGLVVTQSFALEQSRQGEQPLPGVRVRVRSGPEGATQLLEWPDLFGGPMKPPEPPDPPILPEPNWVLVFAVSGAMLAGFVALLAWRLTRRQPAPHVATAEEIAHAALTVLTHSGAWSDPRAAATQLSAIVRDYLAQRTGLDLHARTVRECLALLRGCPAVAPEALPELEALLTWCDATRFAGPHADPAAGVGQAAHARELLGRLCGSATASP